MKKNLLALFVLGAIYSASAQDTYIGNKAIVKVNANTLFYNGGNVTLNADKPIVTADTIVRNQGNIQIQGNFNNPSSSSTGDEFINYWSALNNYGQVIINGSNSSTKGKLTMQKKSVNSASIQQYPMSIPYQGNVETISNSFIGTNFRGNCQVDQLCNQRSWMTLFIWNNHNIVNDAVVTGTTLKPGSYYLLNIISNTGLNTFFDGNKKVTYRGVPAPEKATFSNLTTVIPNSTDTAFPTLPYSDWKNLTNKYNELYWTYLGTNDGDFTSKTFGKNMFRFGNPFTSNIDLSVVSNWLTFNSGSSTKNFEVIKLAPGYTHNWTNNGGSSNNSTGQTQYLSATYTNNVWAGSAEAVLVRPFEMFRLKFNPTDDKLVNINVNLDTNIKTFNQSASATSGSLSKSSNQFYQLEIALVDQDDNILSELAYLSTSNDFETGANFNKGYGSKMSLYEEDTNGDIIYNAETLVNTFNTDYIAKPLHLNLYDLSKDKEIKLKFNLKENNIFENNIQNLSDGSSFYVYDKLNKTYTEIDSSTEIKFYFDKDLSDRFTFFWKETPNKLATDDLSKSQATIVYKYNTNSYKLRFEKSKTSVDFEIYNLAGAKIGSQSKVSTQTDANLTFPTKGMYVIKVIYNDGSTKSLKVLVD
ncbi:MULTISPECIES: T9SS type A sorting domain-containing protein [Empedobacter]|uniref:T9SS type A sorting domain-containing protein n=2 Tax=Pseudomonadati TaxID=3379134 RepID=A0A7H9DUS9_9FLAO|nr:MULTISPECIES: T9SS type A sorting domain-containing protein [Empedobacter]QLL58942.1 T9SS type A sorting domain-containing protein [Empedobacter falsenii]